MDFRIRILYCAQDDSKTEKVDSSICHSEQAAKLRVEESVHEKGRVAKCVEKNKSVSPKRSWPICFFAVELSCYE